MMKYIIATVLLTTTIVMADEIIVTVSGPYMNTSKVITAKETSLGGICDDRDNGSDYDGISAILDGSRVVVINKSYNYTGDFGNETTSKNFIPTNMLPYTFTLSHTTVTVSRTESTPNNESK